MKKFIFILGYILSLCLAKVCNAQSQTININADVSRLYYAGANGVCSDCSYGGGVDPHWEVRVLASNGNTISEPHNVQQCNIGSCGWRNAAKTNWVNAVNVNADGSNQNNRYSVELNGWERDGGPNTCDACTSGDDDVCGGYAEVDYFTIGSIMQNPPNGRIYTFATRSCTGTYAVEYGIFWDYASIVGGSISGNQSIACGNIPNTLTSVNDASPYTNYQWERMPINGNWSVITGAIQPYYYPIAQNETYIYRRKAWYGQNLVAYSNETTITCTTVGTEKQTLTAQNIKIHPNPTTDNIAIDYSQIASDAIATISVFDAQGKAIITVQPNSTGLSVIDLSAYASGLYLVQIRSVEGELLSKKVVKN